MFRKSTRAVGCCRRCGANFRAAKLFEIECSACRSGNHNANSNSSNCITHEALSRKRPLADISNRVHDRLDAVVKETVQEPEVQKDELKMDNVHDSYTTPSDMCMFCELDLQYLLAEEKDAHVRDCFAVFETKGQKQHNGVSLSAIRLPDYECVICGRCLGNRDLTHRLHHIKRCGQKHYMTVRDLIEMMHTHDDEPHLAQEVDGSGKMSQASTTHQIMEQHQLDNHGNNVLDGAVPPERSGENPGPSYSAFDMMMASSKAQQLNKSSTTISKSVKRTRTSGIMQYVSGKFVPPMPGTGGAPYCPSYKKIVVSAMAIPIIVDGFNHASQQLSHLYFLSHFHADHYTGLKSTFNAGIIYCSHVTAALVSLKLKVQRQQLCPLALETPLDIPVGDTPVRVTLIDANHCPGSVMMLFEMPNRTRILHTGDFRWDKAAMEKSRTMRHLMIDARSNRPIDACYLDTTYLSPQYTFPAQEQVIEEVVETVRKHLVHAAGEKILFLFGAYQIGKERVFMQVAREFDMPVFVDKQRYRNISCYAWPLQDMKLITQDKSKSDLWVIPMNQLTFKGLGAIKANLRSQYTKLIAFKPTGWSYDQRKEQLLSLHQQKDCMIYSVPYSEHSSYEELSDFVSCLRPKRVIPTVGCSTKEKIAQQLKILKQFYVASTDQNQSEFG